MAVKQYLNLNNNENKHIVTIMMPSKLSGGVRTMVAKLIRGLELEGFHIKPVVYSFRTELIRSLKLSRQLHESSAVIYTSSIPALGHLIHSKYTKTILFVHGYTKYQLLESLKRGKLTSKLGATYLIGLWKICETARRLHRFMCLCETACEMNGIRKNYILLPEFILPGEEEYYERLLKKLRKDNHEARDAVKILAYTSFVRSPKLLSAHHIEHLMKMVSRRINKRVELIIIDPLVKTESVKLVGSIAIRYIKPLLRMNFLRLVANSDLFIELNIDEELRESTIEAALLETPVAKLTHPLFKDRCDYREDDLIQAYLFKELADRISEYVQNVELYYNIYSKALRDFILKFRTWNYVKRELVEYFKEV
jgi:hypothetical protein